MNAAKAPVNPWEVNLSLDGGGIAKAYSLGSYYGKQVCLICSEKSKSKICESCCSDPAALSLILSEKKRRIMQQFREINEECRKCARVEFKALEDTINGCIQTDCRTYFVRKRAQEHLKSLVPFVDATLKKIADIIDI